MQQDRHTIITRRERIWYPEPQREELLSELHALATDPPRHRRRSIAIVAEGNGGKSTLVKRYMSLHPRTRGAEADVVPSIYVNMSGVTRVEDLSIALLESLHAPDARHGTHSFRLSRFVSLAKTVKLGLVFLDEFHDAAGTTGRGRPFLRCLKDLMNRGVLVVPVGTEELAAVLDGDTQLSSRFNYSLGRLGRIEDVRMVKALMCGISGLLDQEVSDAAVVYVQNETHGVIGHVLDLIEDTVVHHGDLRLASLRRQRQKLDVLNKVV